MAVLSNGVGPDGINDPVDVETFVRDRFVDVFLGQSRRAQFGLLAAAAMLAWVWHARAHGVAALVWLACVATVTLLRFFLTERFVRSGGPAAAPHRIAIMLGVNGVLMSIPAAAFHRMTALESAAVSIILIATATASVITTSGFRWAFLAFATPMLLGLAAAWALAPQSMDEGVTGRSVALLILVYLLFLVGVGRQAKKVFDESSRFRYGEHDYRVALQGALAVASEANRAKTHFLAAASHDLRQPLHGMTVLIAALNLRQIDSRSREIVTLLDSVNQTMSRQLEGLLDVSKLDAGAVKPQLAPLRLDRLLQTHHAALAPLARERGIGWQLAHNMPVSAHTDAALFARVLSNLTDNALKYTRSGGHVALSLHTEGGDAVLRVADAGIGIAAAEQVNVFREFYQAGLVERDRAKGLGLGLSIVKRLCELLGVGLELQSELGVGTTITLRLPATKAHAEVSRAELVSAPDRGLTVLVVDDEPLVRESMRLLLTELSCEVLLANTAAQAMSIASERHIDVALSDFHLGAGDNGVALLHGVWRYHPGARCALVTGDTAPESIRVAHAAGVPLLHKPLMLADLVALLQPADASCQASVDAAS